MNAGRKAGRLTAAAATIAVAGVTTVLGSGVAGAQESAGCAPGDVRAVVTQSSATEFRLAIEAADSTTDCTLHGYPQPMSFHFAGDQVPVDHDYPNAHSPAVRITQDSPAEVRITQKLDAEPLDKTPTAVLFALPTPDENSPQYVAAQWPEGGEIKKTVSVWPVLAA